MSRKVQSRKQFSESPSPSRKITLLKPDFWPPEPKFNNLENHRHYLTRRVKVLQDEVTRLRGLVKYKDRVLQQEVDFLQQFVDGPAETTYEGLKRHISILRGAIERLRGGFDDEL